MFASFWCNNECKQFFKHTLTTVDQCSIYPSSETSDGPIGFALAIRTFPPRPPFGGTPFNPMTAWRPNLSIAFSVCSGVHSKWEMADGPSKRDAQGVSSTDFQKTLIGPLQCIEARGLLWGHPRSLTPSPCYNEPAQLPCRETPFGNLCAASLLRSMGPKLRAGA